GAGLCIIRFGVITTYIYFLFILLINFGIAYRFSELVLAIMAKSKYLPMLDMLIDHPPVALLYVTFNDAIPDLIHRLKRQNYKNYEIFILDDSTDKNYIQLIDNFKFITLRRGDRCGFKAGSLNNWLSKYGSKYKYFIIADSDSAFKPDFIEKIVRYAEHPSNKKIAIFQSMILPWNKDVPFSRLVGALIPISLYYYKKLGNECSTVLSWGHNNIHRTESIINVGGFDERFIAEDFATSMNLIRYGYQCKLVNILSYDAEPETASNYRKRYVRWAKQTIQLFSNFSAENIPFNTRLHLLIGLYTYIIWIILPIIISLGLWGFRSSLYDLDNIIYYVLSEDFINKEHIIYLIIILFYIFDILFLRIPLAHKLGISIKDYFMSIILHMSLSNFMLFPLIYSELKMLYNGHIEFDVTQKGREKNKSTLMQIIQQMKLGVVFNLYLGIGLFKNPLFFIFNFFWLMPFLLSPISIYLIQRGDKNRYGKA
ncbi:MAG TPA: glycosyltransferase family 2 protein, partial [Methanothrix soehngenii]|nr:glycosyltransferase family 2 protein [Methanothrix soehngenii]